MAVPGAEDVVSRLHAFVLLRYTLIIAMGYLLLVAHDFSSLPSSLVVILGAALVSNLVITRIPARITDSTGFTACFIAGDTVWITGILLYSGVMNTDFFYLYFLVILLAATGENLRLIAIGALVVCGAYIIALPPSAGPASPWTSESLIRIPFLFTAAVFYGHLVDRTRRERRRVVEATDTVARLEEIQRHLDDRARQVTLANEELEREIMDRKRAEGELREMTRALQAAKDYAENVIQSSLDMIISVDENRKVVEFNRAAEQAFGYRKAEVIGTSIDPLYADPSYGQRVVDDIETYGSFTDEVMNRRRNGEAFCCYISASSLRDPNGRVVGSMGISRDITAQKRAEEALRWLEKAVNTMELGVTITDTKGKIVYANPADGRMHGYMVEELIGKDVAIFSPPDQSQPFALDQANDMDIWTREGFNVRKDGTIFPVQLMSGAVTNAAGETIGIVTLCEDITTRRRVEEELQITQLQLMQSAKLESVGRLAAGVAHEVKNPLHILQQGLLYLSRVSLRQGDDQVAVVVEKMGNAIKRADRVIMGLLDFSAPSNIDMRPEDLNALVEDSVVLVKHELAMTRIALVEELQADLPPLMLDRHKIQQVFVNIFLNAIQAMPTGGTLTIGTYTKRLTKSGLDVGRRKTDSFRIGEAVVVTQVADTGPGIPPGTLDRVFDPFFTTKPTGQGSGLGLSVTRKIIELHGAMIEISNRREGGALVTLMFRAERSQQDAQEADPEIEQGGIRHVEEKDPAYR